MRVYTKYIYIVIYVAKLLNLFVIYGAVNEIQKIKVISLLKGNNESQWCILSYPFLYLLGPINYSPDGIYMYIKKSIYPAIRASPAKNIFRFRLSNPLDFSNET